MERRTFLKLTSAGALGLFVPLSIGAARLVQAAPIPGGTLTPGSIAKWSAPLFVPPPMPRAGIKRSGATDVDYYEISVRQFRQQVLPAGMPRTTVWGYGPAKTLSATAPTIFHAPAMTIEAAINRPVRVKWINELTDASGNYLPHLFAVDPTLHWANPAGGVEGRDTRPSFMATPGPYTGPIPHVTHVHGAAGVGDESDGYPEAWFLPNARNIPAGYATTGTWYDFFAGKAAAGYGEQWGPGFATFQYPNTEAGTKWYHDHSLGLTRLNVYAGTAGFYIVRGGPQGDAAVIDTRSRTRAVLPGPAPSAAHQILGGQQYFELPIVIQDRSFNRNGELFYPDSREFFDGVTGPYLPNSDLSPIWNPEFFGNTLMVNGSTWPHLNVEKRRYRLRFLNACQARFLILNFGSIPGVEAWQIGNEGGFLAEPLNLITRNSAQLLMGPAERADIIVDFSNVPSGKYVLKNAGPDEPYGGGDFTPADADGTGQILQFRVGPRHGSDPSTPARYLRLPHRKALPRATKTRTLAMVEVESAQFAGSPAEAQLGTVTFDSSGIGSPTGRMWMEPVTENPASGFTEMWEFYNTTEDAHPMHVHDVLFEVINRQDIIVDEATGTVRIAPGSVPTRPEPWETGGKETVVAYPAQVTRIKVRFPRNGQFVWHCHIVEHEDNEMMRPLRVGPEQAGQPMSGTHPM